MAKEIEAVFVDTKSTRPDSTFQGVGYLPMSLPALTSTHKGNSASGTGSGPSTTEATPHDQDQDQAQAQAHAFDWSAQNLDLSSVGYPRFPPRVVINANGDVA